MILTPDAIVFDAILMLLPVMLMMLCVLGCANPVAEDGRKFRYGGARRLQKF